MLGKFMLKNHSIREFSSIDRHKLIFRSQWKIQFLEIYFVIKVQKKSKQRLNYMTLKK